MILAHVLDMTVFPYLFCLLAVIIRYIFFTQSSVKLFLLCCTSKPLGNTQANRTFFDWGRRA